MKISCVILTKNNQNTLPECVKSVQFCDEIVIIDDFSTDGTLKIAKKYTKKIFKRQLNNNYAAQRNFGLSKARNDLVLFIDSDEELSSNLRKEIKNLDLSKNIDGYYIRRQNFLFNKHLKHGEWGDIYLLRLANKNSGNFKRKVHEYWDINGKLEKLNSVLYHRQAFSLASFIKKLNLYSTLHSIELAKEHKKANVVKIIFWPIFKFVNNFFVKRGFLDGVEGFVMAIFMSFHSFLSWTKLWMSQKN